MGAYETVAINMDFIIIIYIIIILVLIYTFIRIIFWFVDVIYHYEHPEIKKLNKRALKNHLKVKYGKMGRSIFKEVKKEIWDKYRIR